MPIMGRVFLSHSAKEWLCWWAQNLHKKGHRDAKNDRKADNFTSLAMGMQWNCEFQRTTATHLENQFCNKFLGYLMMNDDDKETVQTFLSFAIGCRGLMGVLLLALCRALHALSIFLHFRYFRKPHTHINRCHGTKEKLRENQTISTRSVRVEAELFSSSQQIHKI